MMNVGGNRARNGVTDCPESRNEENFQSIELLDSSRSFWPSSRYATGEAVEKVDYFIRFHENYISSSYLEHIRSKRTSDELFSSNHYFEAIRSHQSYQGSYMQVRIVILTADIRPVR
ncbi:hypothetical protein E3N88_42527 [Mikania micrantha]|uniref:Uncharacterized protein n=1 Tax=Mikania micrantha TaxID=192012 RepID=A0A5N6LHJ7_9ASTR|nr:hypothetical protein E3N88_42527 [Mikania micrantha]